MWTRFSLGFALALLVAGCGSSGVPQRAGVPPAQQPPSGAIGARHGFPAPLPKPAVSGLAQEASPASVVVAPGDTVHGVADRYRVSIRDLIDANRLEPPYQLEPGRQLVLPAGRTHRVQRGETLYGISRAYRSDMATLARLNNLPPPYGIYDGQVLRLPVTLAAPATVTVAAVEPPPGPSRVSVEPVPPPSLTPGAPPAALPPPGAAPAGIPGGTPSPAVAAPASAPPAPGAAAGPAPTARQEPPPPAPESTTLASLPPARAGSLLFAWPVRGRMVSGFGPKPGGQHNDGINIEVSRGTPVRAAEAGTVVYAGNELKGYGNLLLIRHAGGWVTAYAHNEDLLVQRGAQVSKGQQIARSGSSGGAASPQLHFEIRKGREPVDPLRYLGAPDAISGAADRAGRTGPG